MCAISYPESSGSLASGWSTGETLGNSKKNTFFDWLPRTGLHYFKFPRVSPGDQPVTKEPEDSEYQIPVCDKTSVSELRDQRMVTSGNYVV